MVILGVSYSAYSRRTAIKSFQDFLSTSSSPYIKSSMLQFHFDKPEVALVILNLRSHSFERKVVVSLARDVGDPFLVNDRVTVFINE